jgi:hypothetical protein
MRREIALHSAQQRFSQPIPSAQQAQTCAGAGRPIRPKTPRSVELQQVHHGDRRVWIYSQTTNCYSMSPTLVEKATATHKRPNSMIAGGARRLFLAGEVLAIFDRFRPLPARG